MGAVVGAPHLGDGGVEALGGSAAAVAVAVPGRGAVTGRRQRRRGAGDSRWTHAVTADGLEAAMAGCMAGPTEWKNTTK